MQNKLRYCYQNALRYSTGYPQKTSRKEVTKAIGYIRVSTEEQTQHGYSLEAQIEAVKKYCELQKWELVRIY